jgi:hypothetical protein
VPSSSLLCLGYGFFLFLISLPQKK